METTQIREHMPVVCSENGQFATVDKVEGDSIKLTKDTLPVLGSPTPWIPS